MKAHEILEAGAKHLADRAATYDKPNGERSMSKIVGMFNILAETNLTVEQGWLFMVLLKMVRTQQGAFKQDSYDDMVAYSGLAGEEAEMARGVKDVAGSGLQACVGIRLSTEIINPIQWEGMGK